MENRKVGMMDKLTNKELETAILFRTCLNEHDGDQVAAVIDLECIQDMITIQKIDSLYWGIRFTKKGVMRKGGALWNHLDMRLDKAVEDFKEFGIEL